MGLFSFLKKNKQEPAPDNGEFYSRAEGEPQAVKKRSRRAKGADAADPILPEKKRARRRLIGALALVLAAVIGLPLILDSEPQPIADDIAIQIPSKDKMGTPRPMVNPPPVDKPAAPAPAAQEPPESTDTGGSGAKDEKPAAPAAPAAAAKTTAPTPAPAAQEHAAKPVPPKPAAGKEPSHDDSARAMALLDGKQVDAPAPAKTSDKYIIQVAALASKAKIDELQGKLKHAGISSYTQTVATQSGERTRVRIGPFSSKDEAQKMVARLKRLGLDGTVSPGAH